MSRLIRFLVNRIRQFITINFLILLVTKIYKLR